MSTEECERGTPALHLNEAAGEAAVVLDWVWFDIAIVFSKKEICFGLLRG